MRSSPSSRAAVVLAVLGLSLLSAAAVWSQQPPTNPEAAQAESDSDPAVALFVAKCSSCHTVGKGDRVGPDLTGVHQRRDPEWLRQIIQSPSTLLARDADARQLLADFNNVRMPDLGLASEQVDTLIDLIARCSLTPCDLVGKFVPVTEATEADFRRGMELFTGNERTAGGSVSCIACHHVSGLDTFVPGGTLAVDLTHVFARLGDEGLDASLKNPAFPLMNKIFADHPLEEEEAFALRSFLYEANRRGELRGDHASLPMFGVLGAIAVLVVLNAFWRRRLRGVRKPLTGPSPSARGEMAR